MNLKEYIKDNILLFDGAMGTYYAKKYEDDISCELANIYNRQGVYDIHKEYIEAGAKCIKTNTFGANKVSLNCNNTTLNRIIESAYSIAKEAACENDIYIFADIGPIPTEKNEDYLHEYIEIVDIFLKLGAQNFIFETFSSLKYIVDIAKYIKKKNPNSFILTQFAVMPDGYTRQGENKTNIFNETSRSKNIDATGFNCISGPNHLLKIIKEINIKDKIVSVMPNAGYPTVVNNRTYFNNSKEYYAKKIKEIINQGVCIVGGCCGTDPKYIKEMAKNLEKDNEVAANIISIENKVLKKKHYRNNFKEKLHLDEKVIAVEIDPPIDTNAEYVFEGAKRLKKLGVDAITIPDCPIARARIDSSIMSVKLKREYRIDAIPHLTCRDRNLNATKALLLGLNLEGVNNVLVVTGDPIPTVRRDEVKSVFEFNSIVLSNYINELNKSTFDTPFMISGALNINAVNFNSQLKKAFEKKENGMELLFTQPILSKRAYKNLKRAKKELGIKILGGIFPIVSYKNAIFLQNEVSGVNISSKIIEMYKGLSKEEGKKLAIELSYSVISAIKEIVDGYYIITPFKRVDIVEDIVKSIKDNRTLKNSTETEIFDYLVGGKNIVK